MSLWWRIRLFIGGELAHLTGWIIPTVESSPGCDEIAEWTLYGKMPDDVTYCCTDHLTEMVTADTRHIECDLLPANVIKCHYLYSSEI